MREYGAQEFRGGTIVAKSRGKAQAIKVRVNSVVLRLARGRL